MGVGEDIHWAFAIDQCDLHKKSNNVNIGMNIKLVLVLFYGIAFNHLEF